MAAAMDFFAHQDKARRNSGLLVFYFCAAVVCIIVGVYAAIAAGLHYAEFDIQWQYGVWHLETFVVVAGVTALIVLSGTLYKVGQLAGPGGGAKVAAMLGGRQVSPNTTDLDERKLLNVVEEMAIASGTPVPPVYVLEDDGINAFAAGYVPSDAVVAVTRGAMRILSRDELQGVIAHEFSHIFNGDMKLNIRLMGVLHGIIVLVLIGGIMLRLLGSGRATRSSGSRKGGGGAIVFVFLVVGLTFLIVGWIGEFFANLIKMAVSREREYLADASAVQFTRNPDGIASALKKIGGHAEGSRVDNGHVKEVSHLFFADGVKRALSGAFATHPPLDMRIRRIDPRWDGEYPAVSLPKVPPPAPAEAARAAPTPPPIPVFEVAVASGAVMDSVGTVQPEHVEEASQVLAGLPPLLVDAAHEPFGARAVVYALLLDTDPTIRSAQLSRIEEHADGAVRDEMQKLLDTAGHLQPHQRLPLLEIALPALRHLSDSQQHAFIDNLQYLIDADQNVSVFEFVLRQLVVRQYRQQTGATSARGAGHHSLHAVLSETVALLSALAWYGSDGDDTRAREAFEAGVARLKPRQKGLEPLAFAELTLGTLDSALDTLSKAVPMVRKWIVDACVTTITCDRTITVSEAELIRAVGNALETPIPILTPGTLALTATAKAS